MRMTADDSLVLHHDATFNKLPVEESTYSELVASSRLSNGEKLPTLREYLLAGMENNASTKLVCEIKPSGISKERGKDVAAKIVKLVHELRAQQQVEYISFDYGILLKIVELNPTATTQYLQGNKTPEQLAADGIKGADYNQNVYRKHPEWIESAKKHKITLNVWTVNKAEDMDWFLANNFDFITTDEPELLFERLNQKTAPVSVP